LFLRFLVFQLVVKAGDSCAIRNLFDQPDPIQRLEESFLCVETGLSLFYETAVFEIGVIDVVSLFKCD